VVGRICRKGRFNWKRVLVSVRMSICPVMALKWLIMCWCAVKKLLTRRAYTESKSPGDSTDVVSVSALLSKDRYTSRFEKVIPLHFFHETYRFCWNAVSSFQRRWQCESHRFGNADGPSSSGWERRLLLIVASSLSYSDRRQLSCR